MAKLISNTVTARRKVLNALRGISLSELAKGASYAIHR